MLISTCPPGLTRCRGRTGCTPAVSHGAAACIGACQHAHGAKWIASARWRTRSCQVGGVSSGCRFHIYFLIPPRPRSHLSLPCDPGLLACFFRIAGPAAAATHATRTCCYALHAGASLLACGCAYLVPRYGPDARRVRRDPLTSATWPRCGPRYPRLSPCSAPTHARRQCWRTVPPRQALGLPVDRGHGCDQPLSPFCRWVTLRSAPMDCGH